MELVISLLLSILLIELYAWLPTLSEWLLEHAVRRLRTEDQERFREEWKADLNERPNTIVRLIQALSYNVAARRINEELLEDKLTEIELSLKALSDKHRINVRKMRETQHGAVELELAITNAQLSFERLSVGPGATSTPSSGLLQEAASSFRELTNAYLKAFNSCYSLLTQMIKGTNSQIEQGEHSIKLFNLKYRELIKLAHTRSFSRQHLLSLKALEHDLENLQTIIEGEHECEENDKPMEEYNKIHAAINQTRAILLSRSSNISR